MLWWKHERPEKYIRIAKFVMPTAYVAGRMADLEADQAFIDYTYIHFSGFSDALNSKWSDTLCSKFGLDKNRSFRFCETSPCLAWNLLYEERKLVWGCEGDTIPMLTEVLIAKTLGVSSTMTNLYPFLMGQAATKHEHIPGFPKVAGNPDNYILAAHCGFFGVVPQSFSTEWKLKKKVLAIVHDDATAKIRAYQKGRSP